MRKAKTINNIADTGSKVTKKAEPEKKNKTYGFLKVIKFNNYIMRIFINV
jgi:hypothetical protein